MSTYESMINSVLEELNRNRKKQCDVVQDTGTRNAIFAISILPEQAI